MRSFVFAFLPFFSLTLAASCADQDNSDTVERAIASAPEQIGKYVVMIFEDSKGGLWFGTLGKGVAHYDGRALNYLTMADGLPDNAVVSMAEDSAGHLWFGTHSGLSVYDGSKFNNYTTADGLCHFRVSNLLIDSKDKLWVGTWGGVCLFDNGTFTDFPLPTPDVDLPTYVETKDWVTELYEDSKGNIWIGRSGLGACKYDPNTKLFTNFTKKDGLPSNCVQDIQEDDQGSIWFGTRVAERDAPDPNKRNGEGGLARSIGTDFIQFPEQDGLSRSDVYKIYKDRAGDIWIGTIGNGVYEYDGHEFLNFSLEADTSAVPFKAVQSILEDSDGRIWLGCSGGLFRLDGTKMINVTTNGPWN